MKISKDLILKLTGIFCAFFVLDLFFPPNEFLETVYNGSFKNDTIIYSIPDSGGDTGSCNISSDEQKNFKVGNTILIKKSLIFRRCSFSIVSTEYSIDKNQSGDYLFFGVISYLWILFIISLFSLSLIFAISKFSKNIISLAIFLWIFNFTFCLLPVLDNPDLNNKYGLYVIFLGSILKAFIFLTFELIPILIIVVIQNILNKFSRNIP